jgi:hypothetical protein
MKRIKDTPSPSGKRSSKTPPPERAAPNDSTTSDTNNNDNDDAMEIDETEVPDDDDDSTNAAAPFSKATPADMYGMGATLIGRRSFGGFNQAMEDAWKGCKATLENRSESKKKEKVSDEELLKRYKDSVDFRKTPDTRRQRQTCRESKEQEEESKAPSSIGKDPVER